LLPFFLSATLQIAEGKNRALKVTQEKSNLVHQLARAEADLSSARAEGKRDQEEIASLREKIKTFNAARIASDKKVAEVSAANSRIEVNLRSKQLIAAKRK
jgi:chromosome segregation ATPase